MAYHDSMVRDILHSRAWGQNLMAYHDLMTRDPPILGGMGAHHGYLNTTILISVRSFFLWVYVSKKIFRFHNVKMFLYFTRLNNMFLFRNICISRIQWPNGYGASVCYTKGA